MTDNDPAPSYGIRERASAEDSCDLHVERVRLTGVTVIDGGYGQDELDAIAAHLDRALATQAARAGGRAQLEAVGDLDTVRCCLAHHETFVRIAAHPAVLAVCRRLLGEFIVLTQQNGIVNPAGRSHLQTAYHRDLPYQHFVSSRPIAVSALFCVDPFTRENGATIVLPGTHRVEEFPSEEVARSLETPVEAPGGSYLVFDSMLFHRAGANGSPRPRRAINHVYGRPFVAQQISMPDVLQGRYADDPALRRLLGYDTAPAPSVEAWWTRRATRPR